MSGVCPERIALAYAEAAREDFQAANAKARESALDIPHDGVCLRCARETTVILYPSMTAYEWDGQGEDPNAGLILCMPCGEEHIDVMEDQWRTYYSGLM